MALTMTEPFRQVIAAQAPGRAHQSYKVALGRGGWMSQRRLEPASHQPRFQPPPDAMDQREYASQEIAFVGRVATLVIVLVFLLLVRVIRRGRTRKFVNRMEHLDRRQLVLRGGVVLGIGQAVTLGHNRGAGRAQQRIEPGKCIPGRERGVLKRTLIC